MENLTPTPEELVRCFLADRFYLSEFREDGLLHFDVIVEAKVAKIKKKFHAKFDPNVKEELLFPKEFIELFKDETRLIFGEKSYALFFTTPVLDENMNIWCHSQGCFSYPGDIKKSEDGEDQITLGQKWFNKKMNVPSFGMNAKKVLFQGKERLEMNALSLPRTRWEDNDNILFYNIPNKISDA